MKSDRETKVMLATMLGALLAKHRVIDRAAIEDPEGYDKGRTAEAILATAGDLLSFLEGVETENDQGEPRR
jgi:hypothetical protein